MSRKIVLLPGDGAGPEVTTSALAVLSAAAERFRFDVELEEHPFGGAAIDRFGAPLTAGVKQACLDAGAVFLGAVGGPKWDGAKIRPETGLLELREALGVFANLRPVRVFGDMAQRSPLTPERVTGVDLLIVRELTGGIYFGEKREGVENASDACVYSRAEVERVARIAFEAARKRKGKVTSVDKANVLATSRLWRAVVTDLHEREFSDVALEHVLVDAMAMKLIQAPAAFDVILTENMFGDILSDEASVIAGSIGLAPSASIGEEGRAGLFEPIHGSAPDIAGQDIVNPVGAVLSVAMMMRYAFNETRAAAAIEAAVEATLEKAGTKDIGGQESCTSLTALICDRLAAPDAAPQNDDPD